MRRTNGIINDYSFLSWMFTLLQSGKRFSRIRSRTSRLLNSVFSTAIRLLNLRMWTTLKRLYFFNSIWVYLLVLLFIFALNYWSVDVWKIISFLCEDTKGIWKDAKNGCQSVFLVPQRSIQSKNISFLPFYNLKNLLSAQRTHNGSSDVKGSSVAL